MLINLALSLRGLGDDEQANRVSLHALRFPSDYTSPYHVTWLAFDGALSGDSAAAKERINALDVPSFDVTHQYVHRLIEALLTVQEAALPERTAACARARQQLTEAARTLVPLTDDRLALLRAYRRCVGKMASDCGSVSARLWSKWRCLLPMLPTASVPRKNGA